MPPRSCAARARAGAGAGRGDDQEATFFNRFGQLIYPEPRAAVPATRPQFSIHRGDLQRVLLEASARARAERVFPARPASASSRMSPRRRLSAILRAAAAAARAAVAIACEGIHSAIRKLLPDEGPPRYSGVNMWRGVTRWKPILSGATMVRAGWLTDGKMVIYPIRNASTGRPPARQLGRRNRDPALSQARLEPAGRARGFHRRVRRLAFRLARRAGVIRAAESVLEYPMVDQDPLPRWSLAG